MEGNDHKEDKKQEGVIRVIHFVTGGGSGATRVALDLALAQHRGPRFQPYLILRSKGKPLPEVMQEQIDQAKLPVYWVENLWPRFRSVRQLSALCATLQPTVFFAHGYSEHLWGRQAALAKNIPIIIHVEHNLEHYLPWRLLSARRLSPYTHATVCVSKAVMERMQHLRVGGRRLLVVHNGVDLALFNGHTPLSQRRPDILMPARFARQKDQPTLIRAAKRLVERGWTGQLLFAGGGKLRHRRYCERLVSAIGLRGRVDFLGQVDNLPQRLPDCRVVALATWREGLPLVLIEAMAAGCAVVASAVGGVTDVVHSDNLNEENGWLFEPGNEIQAEEALWQALNNDTEAQKRANRGQRDAHLSFSMNQMVEGYNNLIDSLLAVKQN